MRNEAENNVIAMLKRTGQLKLNHPKAGDLIVNMHKGRFHITTVTPDNEIWGMSTRSEAIVLDEINLFNFRSQS